MSEKDKHIEDLKEYYKNKKSTPENKPKVQRHKRSMMLRILKYALATTCFMVVIFLGVYLTDKYFVPGMVHTRSKVRIPDVEGQSFGEAVNILTNRGLKYKVLKKRFDPRAPKNTVLRQSPEAGRVVKEERQIYITVSKGAEKITVPKLVGISSRDARIRLVNAGLDIGKIEYKFSEFYPSDTVITQSIDNGKEIKFGEKVDLIVSKGSENQLVVPDLTYLDMIEAQELILELGLRVGTLTKLSSELYTNGTIIGQFPPAGEEIQKNSYVDLEVVLNR